jgi:3-methyladenine DNA glycosylase/8-oxoguanine DNA glycosylase
VEELDRLGVARRRANEDVHCASPACLLHHACNEGAADAGAAPSAGDDDRLELRPPSPVADEAGVADDRPVDLGDERPARELERLAELALGIERAVFLDELPEERAAGVEVAWLVLSDDHTYSLLFQIPDPYDFELSMGRFRIFGTDLANRLADRVLYRAVAGREVRIAPRRGGVDVEPLDEETLPVIARLLGLPFDLDSFYRWVVSDGVLGSITERLRGFRPPLQPDPFEALVTSVTAQQISLFAAVAIRNRLVERLGRRVGEAWAFLTRERIASASVDDLRAVGFTRRKAESTIALARGDLDLASLANLPDVDVRARITAQPGLGPWTAEWFLARHLARPHAWPAGDLALRRAVESLYGVPVTEVAPRLHPFENLSAHYLLTGWLTRP